MDNFIDISFRQHINSVIQSILPNLSELQYIQSFVLDIIEHISQRFCFDLSKKDLYYTQFTQKNNRDIKSILSILLPYIDDMNGTYKLHHRLKKLADISTLKANVSDKSENPYVICNIQFDRKLKDKEYEYSIKDVEINYHLIKDSLDTISNKLYVNWINVIPYSIREYRSSLLYQSSYKFDEASLTFKQPNTERYIGLHKYDIFNSMYHHLFLHIVSYKWCIYEKQIYNNQRPVLFIENLNKFIPLSLLINHDSWDFLLDNEKQYILDRWSSLLTKCSTINYGSSAENKLNFSMLKNIILHFEKYYMTYNIFKNLENAENNEDDGFNYKSSILELDYTINNINTPNQTPVDFIKSVYTIELDKIYNFLSLSVREFSKSWYGKKFFNKDYTPNYITVDGKKYYVTLKTIYNYAKSICFEYKDNFTEARCLSNKIDEFINKLNNNNDKFRIPNNLTRTYGQSSSYNAVAEKLSIEIRKMLMSIVFETHIYNGLLSKFVPLGRPNNNINIVNSQTLHYYYYLTDLPYKAEYLQWILNNRPWYSYYALDWVFQLSFYHKFLNNRLMYITGATGQGKSTQVPKLLYYGVKAFCMKENAKVISTQPRTKPTIDNARTISEEMGVPIHINNYTTDAGYLQYSTKEEKHMPDQYRSFIREVTDKTLFDELLKNPLAKINNTTNNIYDVIIIDEAHEHNINMDLILTLMKTTLYYNNELRLVITSATMDFDEPKYRNYYRHIDDNLLFPLNLNLLFPLKLKFVDNGKLDRIVVDRRIHISPPGESTQKKVYDVWSSRDPLDYKDAESMAISKALNIASYNKTGDVLLFSIGTKEVINICEILNKHLPSHAIALPFYRELPETWKNIATIPNMRSCIKFNKTLLFQKINNSSNVPKSNVNYTLTIIVATNIAEASITIPNLSYVIETGFAKSFTYDAFSKSLVIKTTKINNMNRIQRRGRVGRIADGTVYYMYTQNFLNNVPFQYGIANKEFSVELFMMCTNETTVIDITKDNLNTDKNDSLNKLRLRQIFYNGTMFSYEGNTELKDIVKYFVPTRYIDGKFKLDDLLDKDGTFYLIHPREDLILRNIYDSKPYKDLKKQELITTIPTDKLDIYLENCYLYNYILRETKTVNPYMITIKNIAGELSELLTDNEQLNLSLVSTLVYANAYNCVDEVLKIISWICIYQNKPSKLLKPGLKINSNSELLTLLQLSKYVRFDGIKEKNITPSKNCINMFLQWSRKKNWYDVPFNPIELEAIHGFISNKKESIGAYDFNKKTQIIPLINNIIINKYIDTYFNFKFAIYINEVNDTYIRNFFKDKRTVSAFEKIKEEAKRLSYIPAFDKNEKILRSFIEGFPGKIIKCNDGTCKNIYTDSTYNKINSKLINHTYGYLLYLVEDSLSNEPIYLSNVKYEWIKKN